MEKSTTTIFDHRHTDDFRGTHNRRHTSFDFETNTTDQ